MQRKRAYLSAILSGVMLALAYPPLPLFPLAFIALAPLLRAFEELELNKSFRLIYITFLIYHIGSNWWISSWQPQTDPYLLWSGLALSLAHPVFFMFPFVIYFPVRRRLGRRISLMLFPFIWVCFEWLHGMGDLGYPWLSLGYTQIYNHYWVQAADIFSVYGLSLIITFVNSIIVIAMLETSDRKKGLFVAAAALIVVPIIYGVVRTNEYDSEDFAENRETVRVGVIQPNINPWAKWDTDTYGQIKLHMKLQDSLIKSAGPIDLGLWSETTITYLSESFNRYHKMSFLHNWVDQNGAALLTGFSDFYFYRPGDEIPVTSKSFTRNIDGRDSTQYYDTFNSALLINPGDKRAQIYHKSRLTPFGEQFPFAEYLGFMKSWFEWGVGISSWQKGSGPEPTTLLLKTDSKDSRQIDSASTGQIICIESIFPEFARELVAQGAEYLVVITNDAWYNYTPGLRQHFLISCMRAIETKRYVARSANSGISGFISPTGRSIAELPPYTRAGLAHDLPLLNSKTFYVMTGNWLQWLSVIVSGLALIYSLVFVRKKL